MLASPEKQLPASVALRLGGAPGHGQARWSGWRRELHLNPPWRGAFEPAVTFEPADVTGASNAGQAVELHSLRLGHG